MLELLEKIASDKIRFKRFKNEDYIHRACTYFNINLNNCTCTDANNIVKFINQSNSKCHISYWILRTDLHLDEIKLKVDEYKKSFVTSSYKYVTRKTVSTKFTTKYKSRGYSGYTTVRNTQYYCRSKNEFLTIHYLDKILPNKYHIKYEGTVYVFGNISYKPDYFIYDENNKLIYVLEIKGSKQEIVDKYLYFQRELSKIDIKLDFIHDIQKVVRHNFDIQNKLKSWLNNNQHQQINHVGKNNPRYGTICSESTKQLIGQKARERSKDIQYTNNRVTQFYVNRIIRIFGYMQFDSFEHLELVLQNKIKYNGSHRYIKQSIEKYKKYFPSIQNLNKQIKNKNNG